jgi:hypothetical protein
MKKRMIDLVKDKLQSIVTYIYIYTRLDIALSMNQRILTKHGENLYSNLSLICENQTLRFFKLEPPVL